MEAGNGAHLTPEAALQIAMGRAEETEGLAHLDVCEPCRNEVAEWKSWTNRWTGTANSGELPAAGVKCLPMEKLALLGTGGAGDYGSEALLHAASCDRCGILLREAMTEEAASPNEVALIAALETASPAWRRETAASLVPQAAPRHALRWLALAATVVVSVSGTLWLFSPERLLSRAYTADRPFEYRLPDAGHVAVRQQRSSGTSAFDSPLSLSLAIAEINFRLSSRRENGPDLFLKGRADLLDNRYAAAIESLTRGLELQHGDANALADLACAYALRGDVEKRNLDYGHAIDLLLQSLRASAPQPRTIYNLALIYGKLSLIDEAVDTWDRYLKLDATGGWAAEARSHRDELEKIRINRKKAESIPRDPGGFLAAVKASAANIEPELYLDSFWESWLPAIRTDAASYSAATGLSRMFDIRFHDGLLRDAIRAAGAVPVKGSLNDLSRLLLDNRREQYDDALERGVHLISALKTEPHASLRMRATLELAYAYGRTGKTELCLSTAASALRETAAAASPWLRSQLHLQHAACLGRTVDVGPARAEMDSVRRESEAIGLPYLALKSATFLTNIDQHNGSYVQVWKLAPPALGRYWMTAASGFRAQQLIHDMQASAAGLGWKQCAIVLERAVIRATQRSTADSPIRIMEAVNRVNLATLLQNSGDSPEALRELDSADRIFRAAPSGLALATYKLDATLQRAVVQAAGTSGSAALRTLQKFNTLPESVSDADRVRIFQAKGLAQRRAGMSREAQESFDSAIRMHLRGLASLRSAAERISAAGLALDSYRNLTELRLAGSSDASRSLLTWETYRRLLSGAKDAGEGITVAPSGATVLVFAALPSGVAAWRSGPQGITGGIVAIPADRIELAAAEFLRLAASPASDLAELGAVSRRLYGWLIKPLVNGLQSDTILPIDADGWLASIPFNALIGDSGEYLAAHHPVAMISDIGQAKASARTDTFTAVDRALIASVTAPVGIDGVPLPPLDAAGKEALDLRRRMANATLLSDGDVTPAAVAQRIPNVSLFHFAGHGWADGGNGALLLGKASLGAAPQDPSWLGSEQLASQDWSHVRLAVLSACLTAAGEARGPVNSGSLVRAALAAGASRVIAARWNVDAESTAALMKQFYDRLFAGSSPAAALAGAELHTASDKGWTHPYYWAGFDVFGSL